MTQKAKSKRSSRIKLILVFCLFLGPLTLSFVWYYGLDARFVPAAQSNYSVLITPPVSLKDKVSGVSNNEGLSLSKLERKWTFLHLINDSCDESCQIALYNTRQVRRAVGKDRDRVQRIVVYSDKDNIDLLRQNNQEAVFVNLVSGDLTHQLKPIQKKYGDSNNDIYIVDPLGNVVIYIPPDLEPRLFLKDLKKLLKVSHIG